MRIVSPLALALGMAGLVAGCGEGGRDQRTAVAVATSRPDSVARPEQPLVYETGDGVFGGRYVATVRSDPKTWNPMTARETSTSEFTSGILFEGLVKFDHVTHEIGPALATSWEAGPDSLEWTFHLRRGLRWSDGTPLTAADVLFTAEVFYDADIHASGSDICKVEDQPFRFHPVDDHTVRIELPGPYGPFLSVIGSMYVIPRHMLETAYREGELESAYGISTDPARLVTSGPWRLASYQAQQRISFRPNPYYYRFDAEGRRLPYLDELVYLILPDQNAELLKFEAGDTDQIYFRAEDYARLKDGEAKGDYTVYELGMEMGTSFFWFNQNTRRNPDSGAPYVPDGKQAIFGDLEFRRAVSHAVDREAISNGVYFGLAEPAYGPIPPVNRKWYNPDIVRFPYEPERARAVLEAAGYRDTDGDGVRESPAGIPLSFTLITNVDSRQRVAMANMVADDLKQVGIECRPTPMEFNAVITKLTDSWDYDACLLGLTGGIPPDPIMSANVFLSSGSSHFWDPRQPAPATEWEAEVDRLMREQVAISDPTARKRIFDRVQILVSENIPAVYLVSQPGFLAVRNRFRGFTPTVLRPWVLWQSELTTLDPEQFAVMGN
jgi:peptide/nickel transport system substrate-binding protein